MVSKKEIITTYEDLYPVYKIFCERIKELLEHLVEIDTVKVHSISYRIKSKDSFEKKITLKGDACNSIEDVTDISGIRVITYLMDDVNKISNLIEKEFTIDEENSINKLDSLDPDRFGYLSQHYIVSLTDDRLSLAEYQQFKGLKAEIQVRSILQHAWAEIEHDLGYKSKTSIPKTVKRQFYRLAGMLELADEQFLDIRDKISNYEQEISEKIKDIPEKVSLDKVSYMNFVLENQLVKKLDAYISDKLKFIGISEEHSDSDRYLERLKYFNINTIGQLDESMKEYESNIIKLTDMWSLELVDELEETFSFRGISIHYLVQLLSAKNGNKDEVRKFIDESEIDVGNIDKACNEYFKALNITV